LSLAVISVALSPHPKIPFLADKVGGIRRTREPDLGVVGNGVFLVCAIVADSTQALRTADSIPPELPWRGACLGASTSSDCAMRDGGVVPAAQAGPPFVTSREAIGFPGIFWMAATDRLDRGLTPARFRRVDLPESAFDLSWIGSISILTTKKFV
jgi:hypothetical protein